MREVHTAHRERRFVPSSVPHELPGLEDLYTMLDKRFEKDEGGDVGRNCTAAGQWTLAGTLRYLAAESTYEVMDRGANSQEHVVCQHTARLGRYPWLQETAD